MRRMCVALAFAAVASMPQAARANGRFPESNALFFSDAEPDLVVARMTFGLLVSRDRGATWGWVCERAFHTSSEDPMIVLASPKTMMAGTLQGLSVTRDDACTFDLAGGDLASFPVVDLATSKSAPGSVVLFASSYVGLDDAGAFHFRSQLFETKDEARTFTRLPGVVDETLLPETVDVAPSDPDRVYLSGQHDLESGRTGFLLVSRDHAKTFDAHAIPLAPNERAVFIAAVDPKKPDRVYLRTSADEGTPGRLLVTDDAGGTFRTVLTSSGRLAGFALTDDGARLYVGGPKDGLLVARTDDFAFAKRSSIEIGCIAIARDGLWACSTEKSGFVVGVSADDGATFTPRMHFCDVPGVLACPAATPTAQCSWPAQRTALGCDPDSGITGDDDAGARTPSRDAGARDIAAAGASCGSTPARPGLFAAAGVGATIGLLVLRKRRRLAGSRRRR